MYVTIDRYGEELRRHVAMLRRVLRRHDIDERIVENIFRVHIYPMIPTENHEMSAQDINDVQKEKERLSLEFIGRYVSEVSI